MFIATMTIKFVQNLELEYFWMYQSQVYAKKKSVERSNQGWFQFIQNQTYEFQQLTAWSQEL